jgi:cation:H+ antiporter
LYFGAEWFVGGAKGIAQALEISDYIIGVTVVAVGTSVPELVASVIASLRRQTDISIGNLIGSNIFNLGLVLGSTATISPLTVDPKSLHSDFWWMLGVALLLFPLILSGFKIKRWEGALLVACYGCYLFMTLK